MRMEPSQVKDKFGPLFSQRLLTLVDVSKGVAEIIETCAVRGTIERDAVNRCRAGGLIDWCEVEGTPPELKCFGRETKRRLVTLDEVNAKAKENDVEFVDILGEKAGRIGALAALALSEERVDAAALYNDKALSIIRT